MFIILILQAEVQVSSLEFDFLRGIAKHVGGSVGKEKARDSLALLGFPFEWPVAAVTQSDLWHTSRSMADRTSASWRQFFWTGRRSIERIVVRRFQATLCGFVLLIGYFKFPSSHH